MKIMREVDKEGVITRRNKTLRRREYTSKVIVH